MNKKNICTLKASSSVRSSPMYTGRTLVRSSNPKRSIDDQQRGNRQRTKPSAIRRSFLLSSARSDEKDDKDGSSMYTS